MPITTPIELWPKVWLNTPPDVLARRYVVQVLREHVKAGGPTAQTAQDELDYRNANLMSLSERVAGRINARIAQIFGGHTYIWEEYRDEGGVHGRMVPREVLSPWKGPPSFPVKGHTEFERKARDL